MNTYTPPDKIEIYAAALQSDIGAERFEVVEGAVHDRDVNAARNILAAGHRRLAAGITVSSGR